MARLTGLLLNLIVANNNLLAIKLCVRLLLIILLVFSNYLLAAQHANILIGETTEKALLKIYFDWIPNSLIFN